MRIFLSPVVLLFCAAANAQHLVNDVPEGPNRPELVLTGHPAGGGTVVATLTSTPGAMVSLFFSSGRDTIETPAGTVGLDLELLLRVRIDLVTDAGGLASRAIAFPGGLDGRSWVAQAAVLPATGPLHLTNTAAIFTAGAQLFTSPSALVSDAVGSTQQLSVFLEQVLVRAEITRDPGTSFSSNNVSVAVDSTGRMTMQQVGHADVSALFGGLGAVASVDVDPTRPRSIEAPIGRAGGHVVFADGTGVRIPARALSMAQTIALDAVALPPGTLVDPRSQVIGEAIDFTPTGLSFDRAVEVSMGYDPAAIPAGFDEESLLVHLLYPDMHLEIDALTGPLGEESESVNQSMDRTRNVVSVSTFHFSCRALAAALANNTSIVRTAPDGTTLAMFQNLKPSKPGAGPDGEFGRVGCDDNADGNPGDKGEFRGGPGPAGNPCPPGPVDDVDLPIPMRTAAIDQIILHSTGGVPGVLFSGEVTWASSPRNCLWAHYYVGNDGTIVQITLDDHVANHATGSNNNAIGIEIFRNSDEVNYPGRQVAAVIRLCDFLLREHAGVARPSATNPSGGFISHHDQDTTPPFKPDPIGNFRLGSMGASTPLESIIYQALRDDSNQGLINTKGGDALGVDQAGKGGAVELEMGSAPGAGAFDGGRPSILVPQGVTCQLGTGCAGGGGTDFMHLIVDGTLLVAADTTLDLDGIAYVSRTGTIDARGGTDGASAFSLDITADGFLLVEGQILLNGTDKLGAVELAPFNRFPVGTGDGNGGDGARFRFSGAAAGYFFVPTILTRGGDADTAQAPPFLPSPGGDGGNVTIEGQVTAGDDVLMVFNGRLNAPDPDQVLFGMPDYMPVPSPFNWMPIVTAGPIPSGTCGVDPSSNFSYLRPLSSERLAMGRTFDASRVAQTNISLFQRGILTVGGVGGAASSSAAPGDFGGNAGTITITNHSPGTVVFRNEVQLIAGAGAERLASVIFITGGGCGDFAFFNLPSGGTGGRGVLPGGAGGVGGNAGAITITAPGFGAPTQHTLVPVMGFNGDNPTFSGGTPLGSIVLYPTQRLTTCSVAGSGGSSGGSTSGFPGFFGLAGSGASTVINGQQYFP